ncbi:MAG: pyridoxal phosphate-dependent aminotransferase [Deltaproteobacteria bacterium]|nr:pyridoxal phosphate-dependent aminotransferase [Deltaproteobacteria bacterium]
MSVADKISGFMEQSSWIRKMFEEGARLKAQLGPENVYDFSLGNPNLEPPEEFHRTLKAAVDDLRPGTHAYMPNAGFADTRAAVAEYLSGLHKVAFGAEHVLMSCGAAGALNCALKAILNPGDEIATFRPFFVEYTFYVDNHGGKIVTAPVLPDFSMDLAALEAQLSPRTAAVLINSPNNPTGKVYIDSDLEALGSLLDRKNAEFGRTIYLIADEPYRKIVYDGVKVPSPFQHYINSLVVTSYSKDLSLPGERIGFLAVHPEADAAKALIGGAVLANRILGFVNAPALMQRVVRHLQGVTVDISVYQAKRDLLCDGLAEAGYDFHKPEGAFYLFPKSPIPNDVEFVAELQKQNILAVPGTGFGGPGYFRLAYCVDDATIQRSMPAFKRAMGAFIRR